MSKIPFLNTLRTLPMRQRLALSGIISTLTVVFLGGIALYGLWNESKDLEIQITTTKSIRHQMTADMVHESLVANVSQAVLGGPEMSEAEKTAQRESFAEDSATLRSNMGALLELDLPADILAQVRKTMPLVEEYIAGADEVIEIAFRDEAAARAAFSGFLQLFDVLEVDFSKMGEMIQGSAAESSAALKAHASQLMYIVLGALAFSIVAIAYSARKVTLAITEPMERLSAALQVVAKGEFNIRIWDQMRDDDIGQIARDVDQISAKVLSSMQEQNARREASEQVISLLAAGLSDMAAGNLRTQIEQDFDPEYEPLRRSYNETLDRLNSLMRQVVQASKSIESRSSIISQASQDLSQRTETQAATLEETAAALEMLTTSVSAVAGNAREVESAMDHARDDVETSGHIVEGAVQAMREIEASSSQISRIIAVIDDIAFQTNLLSLNAGVEAARAGESGRGFAVVASEVRALAQRSAESANEIKGLINSSSQQVEDGVRKINGAGQSLSSVVTQVTDISKLVSKLASETSEQATGLNEINIGVSQLDQVTQSNAAMVEESGTAIRQMNDDTTTLNRLINKFTLADDSVSHASERSGHIAQEETEVRYARSA